MMVLQTLLVLSATLLLCSGARLPRQLSLEDKLKRLPDLNTCGLSDVLRTSAFDARLAEPKELPWFAFLGYVRVGETDEMKWLCGGSLVTNQHVLTAAYCVHPDSIYTDSRPYNLTTVRLGELDLDDDVDDGSQPQDIAVDSIIWHKQYNHSLKTNNIAIVKMKTAVTFTSFIMPICLPTQDFVSQNVDGYFPSVAGRDNAFLTQESHLRVAGVQILNIDECRRNATSKYDRLANVIIDSRIICTSSLAHMPCEGSPGGPLMMHRKRNNSDDINYFLMGIISFGDSCRRPIVYTNVSSYTTWIIDHLDI